MPVYSIDNPPRYASGPLSIAHAVHYTHIDFAARYKRMCGYNVMFPLCFDVNGIPIEERVERELGLTRKDIERHEFIKLCSAFAKKNIGEMKHQFKILGESMDASIYYQTDAEYYRRLTQISFIKMFKKGLIYKGERPVNWCPRCMTALADAEVEYKERKTKLNYIKFKIKGKGEVIIATTRPELLPTCQLIAINPEDPRVNELAGKKLITPIFGKEVEVVEDESVALDFGTGIMMICTIGDKDDLEWVTRYNLNIEMGIDEEGRMTEICGKYEGLKIEEARKAIIDDLKNEGILVKQEELAQSVGGCWRCRTPVEFLQVPQWFLNVLDFKEEVLRISDEVNWFPEFMKIRLQEWVNSLSWDWVISRQRYFATSIPLWECVDCGDVVLAEEEQCYIDPTIALPPLKKCSKCGGKLKGCEDVFDTWMDSSITPLYNTFWMRDEEKFKRLYPMSLRPQSHDIIRTWAFYTIIREYHLLGEKPWENIMMGGFILSPDGTPMHASLGNVIDPLPILDEYGADPIRYYAATCALGIDNQFRYQDVKRGGRLCTKLWNVEKYIGNALPKWKKEIFDEKKLNPIDKWILSKYSGVIENATKYMESFQFDKAMREIEFFLWHELADHYIEMVKYRIGKGDEIAQHTLYTIGLGVVKLFAPFLPHLSEEIYQKYFRSSEKDKSVHISPWPKPVLRDKKIEKKGEIVKNLISAVRNWKSEKGIPLSREINVMEIIGKEDITGCEEDIAKTVRAKEFLMAKKKDIEEKVVRIKPIYAKIGPTFKNKANEIVERLKSIELDKIVKAVETNGLQIRLKDGSEVTITKDHVQVEKALTAHGREVEIIKVGDMMVLIGE